MWKTPVNMLKWRTVEFALWLLQEWREKLTEVEVEMIKRRDVSWE